MAKKERTEKVREYLESLDKGALLSIIKYGLRGDSSAPPEVTVEDIYEVIGCQYISEVV
jgi:hypothetical protein